jgi:hypothetical protein
MSMTQKTAAEGKVDLGDLTATVLSALSSMSADARIGGGGVTVGLIVTPQRNFENQRVITPIPQGPPVPQDHGIGKINVEALFERLLDQSAARTLPETKRAEGLATLQRLGVVTEAESKTMESLLKKGDDAKSDTFYADKIIGAIKAALARTETTS